MKTDKPEMIHISARVDLRGNGGFIVPARDITAACKQLDKADYVTFDGTFCYPVGTLGAIVATYEKDARVHIAPCTAWRPIEKRHPEDPDIMPMYNSIALREHGAASTQYLFSTSREIIVSLVNKAHIATLTTQEVDTAAAADQWLQKAVEKKGERPDLATVHGNIAADGCRIHYRNDLRPLENDAEFDGRRRSDMLGYLENGRKNANVVTLDKTAAAKLATACKLAIKSKTTNFYLTVNGRLDYQIVKDCTDFHKNDGAEFTGEIADGYTHAGEDMRIKINPRYLLDAIEKLGAVVIRLKKHNAPVYVTNAAGTHEAIVMPMHDETVYTGKPAESQPVAA